MNQELSEKNQKFKNEIRRRFIDDLFKQQRQQLLLRQQEPYSEVSQQSQPSEAAIVECLESASVKGLYNSIKLCGSFTQAVPLNLYDPVMALIVSPNCLACNEGLLLLAMAIHHSCCTQQDSLSRKTMLPIIHKYEIVQKLYALAVHSVRHEDVKRARLGMNCLKSLALGRVERVREEDLISNYLTVLIQEAVEEPAVLIVMSYVSEQTAFSVGVIREVCRVAYAKQIIRKMTACHILMNYCVMEQNPASVQESFLFVVMALQHLYVNSSELKGKYNIKILRCLAELVAKYPQEKVRELLEAINHSKLQQLMLVLLQVSSFEVQAAVFDIQALIIGKALPELRQGFFEFFPKELLTQLLLGLESSHLQLITRSLQMVTKITHFAPPALLAQMEREQELSFVTENLSYHHNEFISGAAEALFETFRVIKDQQSGDMDQ